MRLMSRAGGSSVDRLRCCTVTLSYRWEAEEVSGSIAVEREYLLGQVSVAEVATVLAELREEFTTGPTDADRLEGEGLRRLESALAHPAENRDAGAVVAIVLVWAAHQIADKVFDIFVDEYLRPRLRERFEGRDLGRAAEDDR